MVDQEAGGGGEREGEGEGKRELLTTHTWRLTSSTPEFPELPPNGSPSCGAGFPTLSLRDFIYSSHSTLLLWYGRVVRTLRPSTLSGGGRYPLELLLEMGQGGGISEGLFTGTEWQGAVVHTNMSVHTQAGEGEPGKTEQTNKIQVTRRPRTISHDLKAKVRLQRP